MRNKGTILVVGVMLALALGGTATAAKLITSKDIKNGTIQVGDLSSAARNALKAQAGPQGAAGAPGSPGPMGTSGITEIVAAEGDDTGVAMAVCPSGMRPVSGGAIVNSIPGGYIWISGMAIDNTTGQTGWVAGADYLDSISVFAYCSAGVAKITLPNGASARPMSLQRVKALALKHNSTRASK